MYGYIATAVHPRMYTEKTTRVTNRKWDAREDVKSTYSDTGSADSKTNWERAKASEKNKRETTKRTPDSQLLLDRTVTIVKSRRKNEENKKLNIKHFDGSKNKKRMRHIRMANANAYYIILRSYLKHVQIVKEIM